MLRQVIVGAAHAVQLDPLGAQVVRLAGLRELLLMLGNLVVQSGLGDCGGREQQRSNGQHPDAKQKPV